jgi:rod shape determining protein RodA
MVGMMCRSRWETDGVLVRVLTGPQMVGGRAPVRPGRWPPPRRGAGVDWVLIFAVVGLCVAGALSVYAATRNGLRAQGRNPAGYLIRDLINVAVGVVLSLPVFLGDYRRLRSVAPLLYAAVCLALLGVLSPLGRVVNGARAWFALGAVQLEPAEFAKLAVIVMIATILAASCRP